MLTRLTESVKLTRDCEGVMIPAGTPIVLPAGGAVVIKQSLGGDYTIKTDCGDMVRIAGRDGDALGKPRIETPASRIAPGTKLTDEMVWDQLRTIYDPEIPVSIVELGLVYDCALLPKPGGENKVYVKMTLTAPGCGMGDVLRRDVERKVKELPGVKDVEVDLVFDPPWSQNMMSDVAKLELGMF